LAVAGAITSRGSRDAVRVESRADGDTGRCHRAQSVVQMTVLGRRGVKYSAVVGLLEKVWNAQDRLDGLTKFGSKLPLQLPSRRLQRHPRTVPEHGCRTGRRALSSSDGRGRHERLGRATRTRIFTEPGVAGIRPVPPSRCTTGKTDERPRNTLVVKAPFREGVWVKAGPVSWLAGLLLIRAFPSGETSQWLRGAGSPATVEGTRRFTQASH